MVRDAAEAWCWAPRVGGGEVGCVCVRVCVCGGVGSRVRFLARKGQTWNSGLAFLQAAGAVQIS